ncbi:hypothetical protein HYALB_00006049 [Hymenoscyphus albidus]|uniref:DUF1746 domain-containing protein n=1 Tax=Hymenoscyphus albidus TaxID=595503 RepID=A0A9N9QCQ1_9HELO|nr:hypothetical protein HYALB_00006049 [Hymenoscyphus albidus]
MNNEPTPTPAALPNPNTTAEDSLDAPEAVTPPPQNALSPVQKRFQAQITKKLEFIDGMIKNLDMLIFTEICILYYMDCSMFRFLMRGILQLIFLTPKPPSLPSSPPHRPFLWIIFGPNLFCALLHLLSSRPEAGESMRGYLHGGIMIDIIGQKGPTSKVHLLILDILVLGLQCFMLSVIVEKERLTKVMKAYTTPNSSGNATQTIIPTAQDHDAEERGVARDSVTENGDIELQPLTNRGNEASSEENEETNDDRARLLAEPAPREDRGDGLDTFWSGRAIIADLHILNTLRRQWNDYGVINGNGTAAEAALQNVGFRAEVAAIRANRTMRLNAASLRFQSGVQSLV